MNKVAWNIWRRFLSGCEHQGAWLLDYTVEPHQTLQATVQLSSYVIILSDTQQRGLSSYCSTPFPALGVIHVPDFDFLIDA